MQQRKYKSRKLEKLLRGINEKMWKFFKENLWVSVCQSCQRGRKTIWYRKVCWINLKPIIKTNHTAKEHLDKIYCIIHKQNTTH